MHITDSDRTILRELASQVAEIAALPVHEETRKLWIRLNGLDQERPMVAIDQIPWHEMNVDDELTLSTHDEFAKLLEWRLRETLYRWRHMRADMLVEPFIDVPKVVENSGFGLEVDQDVAVYDPKSTVKGHRYFDQLATDEDLEKIRVPEIRHDIEATREREETARELFDGILGVRMTGTNISFAIWDRIVTWHGVEQSILDLVDRPDFVHRMLSRVACAHHGMLDQLEEQGCLAAEIPTIHCTGAYSDELPSPGYDPEKPRAKDTWTMGMAQIFSTVSPAMHDEFEIEYAIPWYERFGLGYYGCCEPLHDKIAIIERIPRVRKISISPWADVEKSAERLDGKYVLSRKPSPALLATDRFDPDAVRDDLRATRDAAKAHGCAVEFVIKDISTVRYEPQRLWQWEQIAREVVGG